MATSKDNSVSKSKFIAMDDRDEVLRTEKTLDKLVDWINNNYDAPESVEFTILEVVAVYDLEASKVSAVKTSLDEFFV